MQTNTQQSARSHSPSYQNQKYHFCKCMPNFQILKDSSLLLENCLWLEWKDSLQHTFSSSKVVDITQTIRFHQVPSCYVRQRATKKQTVFLIIEYDRMLLPFFHKLCRKSSKLWMTSLLGFSVKEEGQVPPNRGSHTSLSLNGMNMLCHLH